MNLRGEEGSLEAGGELSESKSSGGSSTHSNDRIFRDCTSQEVNAPLQWHSQWVPHLTEYVDHSDIYNNHNADNYQSLIDVNSLGGDGEGSIDSVNCSDFTIDPEEDDDVSLPAVPDHFVNDSLENHSGSGFDAV